MAKKNKLTLPSTTTAQEDSGVGVQTIPGLDLSKNLFGGDKVAPPAPYPATQDQLPTIQPMPQVQGPGYYDNASAPTPPSPAQTSENTTQKVGDIMQETGKVASILPGIGQIVGAGASVLGVIASWWGADQARKDAQAANQQNMQLYQQQMSESTRRYNEQFAAQQKQQKAANTLAGREQTLQETVAQQNYGLAQQSLAQQAKTQRANMMADAISRITGMFSTPTYRAGFAQMWKGAK